MPASIQQSLVSLGMVMVTGIVNGFGEISTAAFGAASRIDQIAFMPAINFGMAISTLAGQNLGAGHLPRVRQIFAWGCAFNGAITLVISAVAVLFPEALLKVFITDPVVVELGTSYLHIVGACYVLFGLTFVSNGIINGAGSTLVTTVISLLSLWVARVPLAYALSRQMHDVKGIWYAIVISFFVSLGCSMAYYFSGRWMRGWPRGRRSPPKRGPSRTPPRSSPTRPARPEGSGSHQRGEPGGQLRLGAQPGVIQLLRMGAQQLRRPLRQLPGPGLVPRVPGRARRLGAEDEVRQGRRLAHRVLGVPRAGGRERLAALVARRHERGRTRLAASGREGELPRHHPLPGLDVRFAGEAREDGAAPPGEEDRGDLQRGQARAG
ncbi:MATE family efflux transporter [Cystobacter fuscus]